MEITEAEKEELWTLLEVPTDTPLTLENLYRFGLDKLSPRHTLVYPDSARESMTVEFIYHDWDIDCYIRFSYQKEYYGAGDNQGGRYITTALARAILQALKARR